MDLIQEYPFVKPDPFSYHKAAPGIPFLYVNEKKTVELKINGFTWFILEPGVHNIKMGSVNFFV
jgi:hypothetical protein